MITSKLERNWSDGRSARRAYLAPASLSCCPSLLSRAQDNQEKIAVDDVSRSFVVHLPKGYDSQQHYPVVILLHGRNQDADDMARLTHFNQLADKDGIIAVYPKAMRGEWNIGVRPEQPAMAMGPARGRASRRVGRRLSRWRRWLSRRWRGISKGWPKRRTESRRGQEQT